MKNKEKGEIMADKIIIPMKVLAYRIENDMNVPALDPNYKQASKSILGKDVSPTPFYTFTTLQKGLHLHFILPSGMKHGVQSKDGNNIEYPLVPDKYIVTRMYTDKDGKIFNDCKIVDSSFYSNTNYDNKNRITIPFTYEQKRTYRYLGRQYSGFTPKPELNPDHKEGYIDDLRAIGPGDPLFNAYYPNCQSVFGYYDDLEGVPTDAILTYSVIGFYSDPQKDPFFEVKNEDDMKKILSELNLSVENEYISNSCLLFGEVCNIKDTPSPTGKIDIGIGKTSAEALSAAISQKYSNIDMERDLTTIQYDMVDEKNQIDGNFKIDDTIHAYGFSSIDPMETGFDIVYSKETQFEDPSKILSNFVELSKTNKEYGKSRRLLEYKKNTLYYLWEMYIKHNKPSTGVLPQKIASTIDEIKKLRNEISDLKENIENNISDLKKNLEFQNANIKEISDKPFYYPKDPALIFFGDGMKRTYVFGEDGDSKNNNILYCLKAPLSNDIPTEDYNKILNQIQNKNFVSITNTEEYSKYLVMTVMLMQDAESNSSQDNDKKYPPVMLNTKPDEEVLLYMEWQTQFFNDYTDSNPVSSDFLYGQTDYKYKGTKQSIQRLCYGTSVLTPHGVCNLQDKLEKYIQNHPNCDDIKTIIENIRDIPAISQNLGGFTINLSSLEYVFQIPMDVNDSCTKDVYDCLYTYSDIHEQEPERRAVILDNVIPLREGILDLCKLSIVSSFGHIRPIINDEHQYKAKIYFSENLSSRYLCTDKNLTQTESCFLPLTITTPARLSSHFISAANPSIPSCSLPGSSPIIAIIMPDMLNRNLNIYDNTGNPIGILKTVYRNEDKQKKAFAKFVQICEDLKKQDQRIVNFIDSLNKENSNLSELMEVIDRKLEITIPMDQNDFIFGRILVLAEMDIELEYYGGTEFSKKIEDVENLDDKGLLKQEYPVMIGDIERVTDGVICGFYGGEKGYENGFATFGYDVHGNNFLNATHPKVSGEKDARITLLLDPSQKVSLTTGILPVEQIQIDARHTDFSGMNLMSTEMNSLISEINQIQLPDFKRGETFTREYPILDKGVKKNIFLNVVKAEPKIGTIDNTIITDGFIVKETQNNVQ